jgi:SAM-dependent methyltransferase
MYQKYPYPTYGNHGDYFDAILKPVIAGLGTVTSVLEAGCGTGCVTADLARGLPQARVVAFDLSDASLRYARNLVHERGISNVRLEQRNLLDDNADLRNFDFVYCHGVLQTLANPQLGVQRLFEFLRPGGHGYLWTYATLGRRELHDLREALRTLDIGPDHPDRLRLVRPLAPEHFARKVYRDNASPEEMLIHLHDVVYHPHDQDYRVAQLYDMFEGAGFELVRIVEGNGEPWPTPAQLGWPSELQAQASRLPRRQLDALIELAIKPAGLGVLVRRPATRA